MHIMSYFYFKLFSKKGVRKEYEIIKPELEFFGNHLLNAGILFFGGGEHPERSRFYLNLFSDKELTT